MSSRGNCEERSRTRDLPYISKLDYPYVNIHTHARTGEGIEMVSVMAGAVGLPEPPYSLGIHPWQLGTPRADFAGVSSGMVICRSVLPSLREAGGAEAIYPEMLTLQQALREVAEAPASAIGEIGLDYSRPVPRPLQTEVFEAQLEIAQERRLPVVLHCVRAFEPMMDILAKYTLPAVIFHGFIGSRQQAVRAVEAGYYLSFGGRSLESPRTIAAMNSIPVSNLFLETDESALSIADIYSRAGILMWVNKAELKRSVYDNYIKIFGE